MTGARLAKAFYEIGGGLALAVGLVGWTDNLGFRQVVGENVGFVLPMMTGCVLGGAYPAVGLGLGSALVAADLCHFCYNNCECTRTSTGQYTVLCGAARTPKSKTVERND